MNENHQADRLPYEVVTEIEVTIGGDGEPKVLIGGRDLTHLLSRVSWHWTRGYAPRLSLDVTGMSIVNFKTSTIEGTFRSPVGETAS